MPSCYYYSSAYPCFYDLFNCTILSINKGDVFLEEFLLPSCHYYSYSCFYDLFNSTILSLYKRHLFFEVLLLPTYNDPDNIHHYIFDSLILPFN